MLFMLGEQMFNLTGPSQSCEDVGIRNIREFDGQSDYLFFFLLWIPVALAVASGEDILNEIIQGRVKWKTSENGVHTGIISGWSIFTLLSLLSLLLFGRAPVSYVMKFVHVAFELGHLVLFFHNWGWTSHSMMTVILAILAFASTLGMPCEMLYDLTGLGAVLDTFNFVVCLLVPNKTKAFRFTTLAFFWHASYIWAFLLMVNTDGYWLTISLRTYGVFANSLAIYYGARAILITTIPTFEHYGKQLQTKILGIKGRSISPGECMCAQVGNNRVWFPPTNSVRIPSCDTIFPSTARGYLFATVLLVVNGSIYKNHGDQHFKFVEYYFPVKLHRENNHIEHAFVPTNRTFNRVRVLNWSLFFTLFQLFMLYTDILKAFLLAWGGPTLFMFSLFLAMNYCGI